MSLCKLETPPSDLSAIYEFPCQPYAFITLSTSLRESSFQFFWISTRLVIKLHASWYVIQWCWLSSRTGVALWYTGASYHTWCMLLFGTPLLTVFDPKRTGSRHSTVWSRGFCVLKTSQSLLGTSEFYINSTREFLKIKIYIAIFITIYFYYCEYFFPYSAVLLIDQTA